MQRCPHCHIEIRLRELPHQGIWTSYRVCPNCAEKFTVDPATKRRQAVCLVIAILSLVFTILLYFQGTDWLIPSLISYLVLGWVIYWGNKQVYLVPYRK